MAYKANPYVFISYAHRNQEIVLPAIEYLRQCGINLWYDNGIQAGSEWPEFVAEKVMDCERFVLFVSQAYLESQNCKRELNFAIAQKKDILSIFLEDVTLSPGMQMQLGTYQAVFYNRFLDFQSFCISLSTEPFFLSCRDGVYSMSGSQVREATQPTTNAKPSGRTQPYGDTTYTQPYGNEAYRGAQGTVNNGTNQATTTQKLPKKNRILAAVLAFFLGSFGIHKFYLGKKGWGLLYLLFCWTRIPTIISFFDAFMLLFEGNANFCAKYKCRVD